MKATDYLIAGLVGIFVGATAYLLSNNLLNNSERFQADIEQVKPINPSLDPTSTDVFTDDDRQDYSSEVRLNTDYNSEPFVDEQ